MNPGRRAVSQGAAMDVLEVDLLYVNPQIGPFWVEGAELADTSVG